MSKAKPEPPPQTFALTTEVRGPKAGEWYWSGTGVKQAKKDEEKLALILQANLVPPTPPEVPQSP